MAKADAINPNRPASTGETPRLGDNVIRTLAAAIAEQQAVDHFMGTDSGSGYTSDEAGQHKKITFYAPLSAKPTASANKFFSYTKDVSNVAELFTENENGVELQWTKAGVFNPLIACGITGNQTIAGIKTFSDAGVLADGFALASSAAPDADAKLANKKYVDDKSAAKATFTLSGDTVFNEAMGSANAYQSLDLSGKVGSRKVLCHLKVTVDGALSYRIGTDNTGTVTYLGGPNANAFTSGATDGPQFFTIMTHTDGTIRHAANSTGPTITIELVAYLVPGS